MLAISKSQPFGVKSLKTASRIRASNWSGLWCAFCLLVCCWVAHAANPDKAGQNRADHAQETYLQAVKQFRTASDFESAWKLAQACFEWAEFASKDTERAALAQEGMAAARQAIQLNPKSGKGHHYLAMNLGQLARTRKLSALKLVDEMEQSFIKATELEPKLDHASPHRSLGLLYREAPGWPISVGNKAKARVHLQKAAELCPEFPENHLALLETYLKQGDFKAATNAVPAAEKCLNEAPHQFSGAEWEASWQEWKARWEQMKAKLVSRKDGRSPRQRA